MICEECHMFPAVVKIRMTSSGGTVERSLCQACGARFSAHATSAGMPPMAPQPWLVPVTLSAPPVATGPLQIPATCPECGYSFQLFQQTSLLGCVHCYQAFGPVIERILRTSHGGLVPHAGKIPGRRGGRVRAERAIVGLQKDLEDAVAAERYEDAAVLRDRIRELKDALAHDRAD